MKILFCGDRNWTDAGWIMQVMNALKSNLGPFSVIEGEAQGADTIAKECAESLDLMVLPFPADWKTHHKAAGPIRNALMLKQEPAAVIAFHLNLEQSKGTRDMVNRATKAGVPVWHPALGPEALLQLIIRLRKKKH